MSRVKAINTEQWITKLNDMDRILLSRIESIENKAADSTEVQDLTKAVCQLITDIEMLKRKENK
tara:strand:- start:3871 stop:4062 length:192 start_codon:yes stop_codon:yes gene_type:complete